MAVTLPNQKSTKNLKFSDQKFGMIGASGIGKSEFWSKDPNAFFIEAEAGLHHIEGIYKLPCRDWADLREIYGALSGARDNFPYDLCVIDTIDRIFKYAEDEVVDRAREFYKKVEINTIGDIPEGAGWYRMRTLVNNFLRMMEQLPCAVAYIGHLDDKLIKDRATGDYHKKTISIGGKLGLDLLAWTDHTLHVEAVVRGDRITRTVWTKPTQSREAKSRGGIVPDGWKWDDDMKVNYEYFRGLFT